MEMDMPLSETDLRQVGWQILQVAKHSPRRSCARLHKLHTLISKQHILTLAPDLSQ